MPTKKLIRLAEKHIKAGKIHDCTHCPVALAVTEQIPSEFRVSVTSYIINWYRVFDKPTKELKYVGSAKISKAVKNFIHHFDCSIPVKPFSFYLQVPDELK